MGYIQNPKTRDSGILCAIPQKGKCPINCSDCFFNSGRSYLEPLDQNLPNMPDPDFANNNGYVIRFNDGNDSANNITFVMQRAIVYKDKFYNTANGWAVRKFDAPVVLTLNPGKDTDKRFYDMGAPAPVNLMFVRVRVNTWNLPLVDACAQRYTKLGVPVVLTFMAYWEGVDKIPLFHKRNYECKRRTTNEYMCISDKARDKIIQRYANNPLVTTCGKTITDCKCKDCGNCMKYYRISLAKMQKGPALYKKLTELSGIPLGTTE